MQDRQHGSDAGGVLQRYSSPSGFDCHGGSGTCVLPSSLLAGLCGGLNGSGACGPKAGSSGVAG
jgi:hypothetical protein